MMWRVFVAGLMALTSCSTEGAENAVEVPHSPLCERVSGLCDGTSEDSEGPGQSPPRVVVPSSMMPEGVVSQTAHNNLDIAWHDAGDGGRLFFAFRTAATHFAGPEVVMYVVSTDDLVTWRKEGEFALGTDVREPQLVSIGGRLLFYFVVLGSDPFDFAPKGVKVAEWKGPGDFDAPKDIFEPGFLVWRIKPMEHHGEAGAVYAFGYDGGENVYDNDGEALSVRWLMSRDGLTWEAADAEQPVVLEGGASETDAVFLEDGRLIAVARNEAGDETGFGSKICRGEKDSPATWTCAYDKRKYDSPLVLEHAGEVYLVARRNVTGDGHYDLGLDDLPMEERYSKYQQDYWTKPKRCALWKVDPDTLSVSHVFDLPSAGDTCFPEALRLSEGKWLLFNYSSPWDLARDPSWLDGQVDTTLIYWTVLSL
jgi:hypothetical protein